MHDVKSRVLFDVKCKVPADPAQKLAFLPFSMALAERQITISIELGYLTSTDRIYLVESTIESDLGVVNIHKATKLGNAIGRSYRTHLTGYGQLSVDLADDRSSKFTSTPPFDITNVRSMTGEKNSNRLLGTQFAKEIEDCVLRELSGLCYIGPLRERPQRMYISTGEAPREVGSAGELGPAVLWSASEIRQLNLEERLSDWCARMGLALEIELNTVIGSFFEVHVVDPHTKAHISLPDVGFGTSQILPILIQGLVASPGTTLLLEQPEIHLHPKVQADLADFLIEVSQRGVAVVVETHSEHIITRIQRRIAEETLQQDRLALYYLTPSADGSRFDRVHIDAYGQIEAAPEGFFEEGFEETFAIMSAVGARKAHPDQPNLVNQ